MTRAMIAVITLSIFLFLTPFLTSKAFSSEIPEDAPSAEELIRLKDTASPVEIAKAYERATLGANSDYDEAVGYEVGIGSSGLLIAPTVARAEYLHDSSVLGETLSGAAELEYQSYRQAVEATPLWKEGYEYWELYKSIKPGTVIESLAQYGEPLGTHGFYETALLDILIEAEQFDSLWNDVQPAESSHSFSGDATTADLIAFTDAIGKPSTSLKDISITDFNATEQAQLIDFITSHTKYNLLKSNGLGQSLLSKSKNLGDLARNINKLETLADYSLSMCQTLLFIGRRSWQHQELQWACYDLCGHMLMSLDNIDQIAIEDFVASSVKAVCDQYLDKVWDAALTALGGEWATLAGSKGLAMLNRFLSIDEQYEAYRRMIVMDEIQPLLQEARDDIWSQYEHNPSYKHAAMLCSMCDLLVGEKLVGYDYAIDYLDAVDDAILSQILRSYYSDWGPNYTKQIIEDEKQLSTNDYLWANMIVDDLANIDDANHADMEENRASVTISTQEEFNHWVSLVMEGERIIGPRTTIKTIVLDVPRLVVTEDVNFADVDVYGDMLIKGEATLDIDGELLCRGAWFHIGQEELWLGGIVKLREGGKLYVTGDMDIDALDMADDRNLVHAGANLYINGVDATRKTAMVAGHVEIGGNLNWLQHITEEYDAVTTFGTFGFLPENTCYFNFIGATPHSITGIGSEHMNIGRIDLSDQSVPLANINVTDAYMELVSDAHMNYDSSFSFHGVLNLANHSLYAPATAWYLDELTGIADDSYLEVSSMLVDRLSVPENHRLIILLNEDTGELTVNALSIEDSATLIVKNGTFRSAMSSGSSINLEVNVELAHDAMMSIDGNTDIDNLSLANGATLTSGGDLHLYERVETDSHSVINAKKDVYVNCDNCIPQLNGRLCAYQDVFAVANAENPMFEKLVGGTGVLALVGTSEQSLHFSPYLHKPNTGNIGLWNPHVDVISLGQYDVVEGSLAFGSIEPISKQTYTGKEVIPPPTVKMLDTTLALGQNYFVSYENNVEAGNATVTVTGTGRFQDSLTANFEIVRDNPPAPVSFVDVSTGVPHSEDINWLAQNGVSTGWRVSSDTFEFRPYESVARADMAAFLFRMAGRWNLVDDDWQPDVQQQGAFRDVSTTTPHAREVWWLASTGISKGWKVGNKYEFRPYATVARQDMAAFLFRLAKLANKGGASDSWQASPDAKTRFRDVSATAPDNHHDEVWWLAEVGVSQGWDLGNGKYEFRGLQDVARADMAAFLHRMDSL